LPALSGTVCSVTSVEARQGERWGHIDVHALARPAAFIFNPHAGQKLGIDTNRVSSADAQEALQSERIPFEAWATQRPGHATDLARRAVEEGRELVIAAGGDGTVNEIALGLANSQTVLGLMPLGSIMNVARTLWVPRDPALAARTIVDGKILAMDMGRVGDRYFLEAAGVGLDAGLFGYFDQLESGGWRIGVVRAALRFMRTLGRPRITVQYDGRQLHTRAPMVSVANGPYVGAAYAIAPAARIDDGLLDVVVFRNTSIPRVLLHLAMIAGGRPLPPPAQARTFQVNHVRITKNRGRRLPVHADGDPIGVTPVDVQVAPAALRVIVGPPEETGICAWEVVGPVGP
jgi:diacylglycerol kinase (ATP)